ncbi:MAG: signal peptidase II [Firmicutes bacterium]|nr:signal peptidase II [Bacillota bacterium]
MSIKEKFKSFKAAPGAHFKSWAKATWGYIKSARVELIVLAAILATDLVSKGIIQATMKEGQSVTAIPKFLHFFYTINSAAAFGTVFGLELHIDLAVLRVFLLIFSVLALIGFFYCLVRFRRDRMLARITFAMIIAGTLGNFFDRLFVKSTVTGLYGVRDFIQFEFLGFDVPFVGRTFAIFNIADASLVFGVIFFAIFFLFLYKPKRELTGPEYRPEELGIRSEELGIADKLGIRSEELGIADGQVLKDKAQGQKTGKVMSSSYDPTPKYSSEIPHSSLLTPNSPSEIPDG